MASKTDIIDNGQQVNTMIGVGLSMLGSILISFSLNVQKHAHNRIQARSKKSGSLPFLEYPEVDMEEGSKKTDFLYLRSWFWWLGFILMVLGESGNFIAYGYAPASIIAPLGAVSLISNAIIAPLLLQEKFRRRDLLGIVLAVIGTSIVVGNSDSKEIKLLPEELFGLFFRKKVYIYAIICSALLTMFLSLSDSYGRVTALYDLLLVGLFGGFTVLSTKAISCLLQEVQLNMFAYPQTYFFIFVVVSTGIFQLKYLNKALQNFDSTVVIPIQFVLFTLSVVIGSAILYDDFAEFNALQYITFILGCLLTFLGVYFIASLRDNGLSERRTGSTNLEGCSISPSRAQRLINTNDLEK